VATAIAPATAQTQSYPAKVVRFIVTYPPGGSSDVMARVIGAQLTEYWGQQVLVESRPGADGSIGTEYAAKQPADGHTFLLANFGPIVAKPLLTTVSYDWKRDFVPVSRITYSANILVVPGHVAGEKRERAGGARQGAAGRIELRHQRPRQHVAFRGRDVQAHRRRQDDHGELQGQRHAITELSGGQITTMFSDAVPAAIGLRTGKIRALAVTSAERWRFNPELPTLAEAGLKGFAAVNWWGILFPAGTPRPLVDKVNADLGRALASPVVKQKLGELSVETIASTPEQFGAFMAAETERWGKLIQEANLKLPQ
jgi:tripartite-type tricarboxylate transporter receptor subunit TctC